VCNATAYKNAHGKLKYNCTTHPKASTAQNKTVITEKQVAGGETYTVFRQRNGEILRRLRFGGGRVVSLTALAVLDVPVDLVRLCLLLDHLHLQNAPYSGFTLRDVSLSLLEFE